MLYDKVENMETLLAFLDAEQERPEENSFLELHEPEILDDFVYRQIQEKSKHIWGGFRFVPIQ